jgi:hypothetical protein
MWLFSPTLSFLPSVRSTYDELSRCLPRCQGQQQLRRTVAVAAAAGFLFLRHVHRAVKSRGRGAGGHSEEDSNTITAGIGFYRAQFVRLVASNSIFSYSVSKSIGNMVISEPYTLASG